ncbi:probable protein phosphatase 2C 34 [Citrus sinensis]|uniref:probable protein phosphatase 2C 34 n=1 Tax=Citrus sinensis TaxID=2711 RepID=UPI002279AEDC|nr:probable protein phosphatase 2C 34 [Citrus sinensis]
MFKILVKYLNSNYINYFLLINNILPIRSQLSHLLLNISASCRCIYGCVLRSPYGFLSSLAYTEEAERITQSKGLVFCLNDVPGVYRVWMPNGETPGLAISRALGDYCVKDYGLISVLHVTQRNITTRDQFVILASDGVWDVISNQEAVEIVSSVVDREKAAKRLVECAVRAWKYKKRGIAMDDISAICLFFHSSSSP